MPLFDRSGRTAGKLTAGPTLLLASDSGDGADRDGPAL